MCIRYSVFGIECNERGMKSSKCGVRKDLKTFISGLWYNEINK